MKITFYGATETVTGSKTLIEVDQERILIDAGLFQEGVEFSILNLEPLEFDPRDLTAVIITHAHLDHSGYLPYLFKCGFRGPIYLTKPSAKLVRIIIDDSANLMSEEKHPLYSKADAASTTSLFRPIEFHQEVTHGKLRFKFHRAGHILGASFVEIHHQDHTLVFSGDLGRFDDVLLNPPDNLPSCDTLIMETTYGDRLRTHGQMKQELYRILNEAIANKQTLLIPCFALHRAQLMAFLIQEIFDAHPELKVPLAFNSPMMKEVTKVYLHYADEFLVGSEELKEKWSRMHFLDHFSEIENANQTIGAKIIIASSGMVTGGRIWTHLKDLAPKEDTIIFLPGFQSPQTPGYALAHGAKSLYDNEGNVVAIKARVISSDLFSSHADQSDLLAWIKSAPEKIQHIYLIHGEELAKKTFSELLKNLGYLVDCPRKEQSIDL